MQEWMKAYRALSRPPAQRELPLTSLLAGGDRGQQEALPDSSGLHHSSSMPADRGHAKGNGELVRPATLQLKERPQH